MKSKVFDCEIFATVEDAKKWGVNYKSPTW